MPVTTIESLSREARVWIFAADRPLSDAAPLLHAVDDHLASWHAHGVPLLCAREWREGRVLVIAVDESATGASGCSIDGLFRVIARTQGQAGADLLASGRVVWRDATGVLRVDTRATFEQYIASGLVTADTMVLNTLADTLGEWNDQAETAAGASWAAPMLSR
jgi:hypothetical protein